MAFLVSPGVSVTETDLTRVIPNVSTTVGASAGTFQWGPVLQRTFIGSENELVERFKEPDDNTAEDFFSSANFLAYANALQQVRVVGASALNASVGDNDAGSAILIKNEDHYDTLTFTDQLVVAKYPSTLGNSLKVHMADSGSFTEWTYKGQFDKAPGTSRYASERGGSNDEIHVIIIDEDGEWSGVAGTIIEKWSFLSKAVDAKKIDGSTNYIGNVLAQESQFIFLGDKDEVLGATEVGEPVAGKAFGSMTANAVVSAIAILGTNGGDGYNQAPTITIAGGSGTGPATATAVLEGIGHIAVDTPGSGYLIAPLVTISGTGTGAKATATVAGGLVTGVTVTNAGTGYTGTPTASFVPVSGGTGATATPIISAVSGITVTAGGATYSSANPDTATINPNQLSQITFTDADVATGTGIITKASHGLRKGDRITLTEGVVTLPAEYPAADYFVSVTSFTTGQFILQTVRGDTSSDIVSVSVGSYTANVNVDVITGATAEALTLDGAGIGGSLTGGTADNANVGDAERQAGFNLFKNAEEVDISLMFNGPASQVTAKWVRDNIADVRKDLVFCVDPAKTSVVNNPGDELTDITTDGTALGASSYLFATSAWKHQYDRYNDVFRFIPMSGDAAGLMAQTDFTNDAWFSPAGFQRGVIKNIVKLSWCPSQAERDGLYQIGYNPVVNFPGQGIILFGDKTMQLEPSAFDRINVRRLFIVLEKAVATAAKFQLFDLNDEFTRSQFRSMVEPFLRTVQGRRGITDFRVVADATNNPGEVIDRNEFVADIYIKPARSINFIRLNFVATRTSVSFDEIA